MWDRFGWSKKDTEAFTLQELRLLFGFLEQQRVSKDAVENLGRPNPERMAKQQAAAAAAKNNKTIGQPGGKPMQMASIKPPSQDEF